MSHATINPTEKEPTTESGFTLIEVMVALVIFTFGIMAVLGMQVSAIQGNMDAQNITEAASVGANRVEELITQSYTGTDLTDGTHGPVYEDNNKYRMDWTVSTNGDTTKSVNLTVQWADGTSTRKVAYDLIKPQDL